MHNHYINKLLNIEHVIVKKIDHANTFVKIYLETKPHTQICPCCGSTTKRVHDYRYQTIKDLPFQLKHCYLVLHKRRYVCMCGKRFYETYYFLPRYFQRTTRLTAFQKTMPTKLRKYYKRSRTLILSRYNKLKDENKTACDLMHLYNDDLRRAHYLKEKFYELYQNTKYSEQRKDFFDWIKMAESSGLNEFEKVATTYRTWSKKS